MVHTGRAATASVAWTETRLWFGQGDPKEVVDLCACQWPNNNTKVVPGY